MVSSSHVPLCARAARCAADCDCDLLGDTPPNVSSPQQGQQGMARARVAWCGVALGLALGLALVLLHQAAQIGATRKELRELRADLAEYIVHNAVSQPKSAEMARHAWYHGPRNGKYVDPARCFASNRGAGHPADLVGDATDLRSGRSTSLMRRHIAEARRVARRGASPAERARFECGSPGPNGPDAGELAECCTRPMRPASKIINHTYTGYDAKVRCASVAPPRA